jgi:hypothetical protein
MNLGMNDLANTGSDSAGSGWYLSPGIFWGFVYLFLAAAWWLTVSIAWRDRDVLSGVVPDAIGWYAVFADSGADVRSLDQPAGRSGRFFRRLYETHPYACNGLNAAILVVGVWATVLAAERLGGRLAGHVAGAAMAFNPFLWIITIGPTKEPYSIGAAALVALAMTVPSKANRLIALVAIFVLMQIRLEQALVFAVCLPMAELVRRSSSPRMLLMAVSFFAAATAIQVFNVGQNILNIPLGNVSPQLNRPPAVLDSGATAVGSWGLELGRLGFDSPQLNVLAFAYRLLVNPMGCLVRMGVWTASGSLSMLGIGFAITGFLVVLGMVVAAMRLAQTGNRQIVMLALPIGLLWIASSAVPFVQPRYMFAILPLAVITLAGVDRRVLLRWMFWGLFASVLGRSMLSLMGHGIPPWQSVEGVRPGFLLFGS